MISIIGISQSFKEWINIDVRICFISMVAVTV